MGQTHTRHVYNLSSRDVEIYAVKPSDVDEQTWTQWIDNNFKQATKSNKTRSKSKSKQGAIVGVPSEFDESSKDTSGDKKVSPSVPSATSSVDRYLIGSVGFKTSRTLKFPAKATRVTLVAAGGAVNISDIPKMPSASHRSNGGNTHNRSTRWFDAKHSSRKKSSKMHDWEMLSMTKDLVIEENLHGLRTLRLAYRDNKVHGERLLYVVNVDAVEKLVPAIEANKARIEAQSEDRSGSVSKGDSSTTTTPGNTESDVEASSYNDEDEWQWASAPAPPPADTERTSNTIPTSEFKEEQLREEEGITPRVLIEEENSKAETPESAPGTVQDPAEASVPVATASGTPPNREVGKTASRNDSSSSTQIKQHRTVKTSNASFVSSNVFGAVTSAVTGGVTRGVDSYRRQQLERQMALRTFLMSVPFPPLSERAAALVLDYLGKLSIDWVMVLKDTGVGVARGTVMGGTVGAAVMGGMIGFSRAGAMFDAANNVGAATVMRGMGTGLGVMVSAAITACEVGYHVRKCLVVAIIGGVAFNICDATFGWSDKAAKKLVPLSEGEEVFEGKVVYAKMIEAARETLGLSPEEPLDEDDLRHRLRRWMLSLHPDKNSQQVHPHLHTIVTACTLLINEARDIQAQRNAETVDNPLETSEDNDMNPYQLLCLMDNPDTHMSTMEDHDTAADLATSKAGMKQQGVVA
ncbi:hypothetical protein FOL47_008181 [Perkinsus chesapeaki]|uniref:J domain-containing protein n=1 Tax=Perkinsus chesapeaki TaxID=330153 RepID=A0A7J6MUI9_PERCH|nr:hypothetical protein FOL47_008181 [Perkinsus chesapeaki]